MKITILLVAHNEEVMLPHTYNYYKKRFPEAEFVLCITDKTNDNTISVAKERGFHIKTFNQRQNFEWFEKDLLYPKNNYWKPYKGWVIIADMDEWLDIDEKMLEEEDRNNTTIISTKGMQMIHNSEKIDISDIKSIEDEVVTGYYHQGYSKSICFKNGPIIDINFQGGAHKSKPSGNIRKSKQVYYLRHYSILGENMYKEKMRIRFTNRGNQTMTGHTMKWDEKDIHDAYLGCLNYDEESGVKRSNVKNLFKT